MKYLTTSSACPSNHPPPPPSQRSLPTTDFLPSCQQQLIETGLQFQYSKCKQVHCFMSTILNSLSLSTLNSKNAPQYVSDIARVPEWRVGGGTWHFLVKVSDKQVGGSSYTFTHSLQSLYLPPPPMSRRFCVNPTTSFSQNRGPVPTWLRRCSTWRLSLSTSIQWALLELLNRFATVVLLWTLNSAAYQLGLAV